MPRISRSTTVGVPPRCGWIGKGRADHGRHGPPRRDVVGAGVALCWRGGGPPGSKADGGGRHPPTTAQGGRWWSEEIYTDGGGLWGKTRLLAVFGDFAVSY